MARRAAGLLTRGALPCRLPGRRASGVRQGASPLTAAGPSRIRTGFPRRSPLLSGLVCRAVPSGVYKWAPVLAWAGLIFVLSSVPDLGTGLGGWDLALRKIAHAAEYAVLGFLLLRATGRVEAALGLGIAYAVSDEIHQHFVSGRHGAPLDVAIDAVGVAVGVYVGTRWRRASPTR
jgi:VanZ family protein